MINTKISNLGRKYWNLMKNKISNAGPLATNKICFISAILGAIPVWYGTEVGVDDSSAGFQFLQERYNLEKGKKPAEKMLNSIVHYFGNKGITMTMGDAENIICKTKRIVDATSRHNSDRKYKDLHYKGQGYYELDTTGTGIYVYEQDGSKIYIAGNLITAWNWNGAKLSAQEIALKLKENLERPIEYFRCPPEFTCYYTQTMSL